MNLRPIYRVVKSPHDSLLLIIQTLIFNSHIQYFSLGNGSFLIRRRYWRHRAYSSRIFVAVFSDSAIYTDKPHSGLSKVLNNLQIEFVMKMDFLPSEIEKRIATIERKFQTFKC